MKINESGRSMIEMLGVLAIIGVLSVGGIAGYSKAMSKYRVNKTVDQISHIAANTRILFGAQKDYSDLGDGDADIIKKAKLYPDDLLSSAETVAAVTNPFAGPVGLKASKRFSTDNDNSKKAFLITYGGIPEEACVDLLTIDWGTGTAGGIIALGTSNVDSVTVTPTGCSDDMPAKTSCGAMDVTAAVDACGGDDNTLYFKFY